MKFVKKINNSGKAEVCIDLEGLKVEGSENVDVETLLSFKIETYSVLKAASSESDWNTVFGLPQQFLNTLSDAEKCKFAQLLMVMHYEIMSRLSPDPDIDGEVLIGLETQLSKLLADFDQEIDLVNKLIEFTEKEVPIQSFSGVGERAQDSAEMTFYRDDVVKLTAVVILCKLMTPIVGIFIETCKKRMDNGYKEIHCYALFKDILNNRCKPLIDKLQHFIKRIIQPMLNRLQLTHTFHGYTVIVIALGIEAGMFTRRFVTVDLLKPNGNLITYVTSCARAAAQTQFSSSAGFKQAVKEMFLKSDESSSDEGNMSTLEEESRTSAKTVDFPVLIQAAAHQLYERFITQYALDPEMVQAAVYFYEQSHIVVTPINSYLMCNLFGADLGGGRSVEMLDMVNVTKLVALMQCYLLQQGYLDLVHAVTALPTTSFKAMPSGTDVLLASSWNNSHSYRNCDERFPYVINDMRWDTSLKAIVDKLTTTVFLYNTAPVIWDQLDIDVHNGSEFQAPETISKSICSFILQVTGEIQGDF